MPETPAHSIETLIEARWVIPVEPSGTLLTDHSVAVDGGRIVAILPTEEARRHFVAQRYHRLTDHALIPGLINLHTHAAMTLLRGYADDLPLMEWLKGHIWPTENRHISPDFVRDGTRIACAEMLRGGTTCFNDMYFFPEAVAEAALGAGMRAAIGLIVIDFPTAYAGDSDDYLNKGFALRDRLRDEPLLCFTLAPHAPYTVGDKTFGKIATFASQLDLPIHVHLHETEDEIRQSLAQHNLRPLARLHNLGLLGPGLIAVHGVHLTPDEQALLAEQGCHVAHCPASNLKLASGFAPVVALAGQGVNIGIGTDGAASNNKLDMFSEMRLAALLAKGVANAAALPAHAALQMATLNGARALGLDDSIGSLAPGKLADIVAVDLSGIETQPCFDPISTLVYAAGREQVSHVWVGGELRLDSRQLTRLDERELKLTANVWQSRITH
ncbi:N-ethylammeline chlorohydrolase [Sulfuriferula plumbiphila]|uniref:5-methylthioadenosine/S-adenosylhomocysteine deaminase n=1 Tax=Sulfuriferula plumbiphila TaxID=171865 RepID=A0A512L813_9PROT|nr:TRZ/ATZ family hydrolase [Sulfuriferula plumbiphila]BBP04599.1 N-ethylammeline chlorohydrolase [Sulfuriferula plumbiphila]GEP30625.1 N-ethylammeline chlorohydrolase [Sulfuriferula plumbiphila]